jgi:hypothetical protein
MRPLQLLAIAALCPLAAMALGACERIVQPVGAYEGAPRPIRPADTLKPDAHVMQATAPGSTSAPLAGRGENSTPEASIDGPLPDSGSADSAISLPPLDPVPDAGGELVPRSEACSPTAMLRAERPRLDMYIVMDANITLPFTGAWEFATTGLQQFVADKRSQGIGIGLRLFGLECDADVYDTNPTVEVDLVSKTASDIIKQTSQRINFSASPMLPALQGGIRHQRKRAMNLPNTKQIVVLLTDGIAQDVTCYYTEQAVEMAAHDGFSGSPAIETDVIGFGLPSTPSQVANDILARFLPLTTIAEEGGGKAQTLDSGEDASMMNEALQRVRRAAQPCEYLVPRGPDPTKLILVWSPGGEVPKVDNASSCGRREGWHFDVASDPKRMVLCPTSCGTLQASDTLNAQLFVGCPPTRRVD